MQRLFDWPFSGWLAEHSRPVILAFAAVSALLVIPHPGEATDPEKAPSTGNDGRAVNRMQTEQH